MKLLYWDIYEIKSEAPIVGVMFRGRVRKFCLEKGRNVLVENTQDVEQSVRFAVPSNENVEEIKNYIQTISSDASIEKVKSRVPNPVLSKLKVNTEDRYSL